MKIIRIFFLGFTLLIVFLVVATLGAYRFNTPSVLLTEERIFVIPVGESFSSIAERLQEEGIIKSAILFKIFGKLKKTEKSIKKGYYLIKPNSTALQIHDLLISGQEILKKVTIPEGWTSRQISELLEEKGFSEKEEFLKYVNDDSFLRTLGIFSGTAEGYIFPDTYYFPEEYPPSKILAHMIATFFNRLEELKPDYKTLTPVELQDKIILASVVEREYRVEEEAPIIASVFYNRLSIGMPLQSCATVAYVISEIMKKPYPDRLFYRDLEIDSPYNTYKYPGLPILPICNPSATAIKAVFYPAKTNYLFFVIQDLAEGKHYFSKTLSEHSNAFSLFVKKR